MRRHPLCKARRISCLHHDSAGPRELAHQSFPTADTRDNASTCNTLHNIFAIPGHKMAIVDDIFLTFDELSIASISIDSALSHVSIRTYIFPYNGAEACQPKNANSANLVDKEPFA